MFKDDIDFWKEVPKTVKAYITKGFNEIKKFHWKDFFERSRAYIIGYSILVIVLGCFAFDMGIYGLQKDAQFVKRMNIIAKAVNGEHLTEKEWDIYFKHREEKMSKSCFSLYSSGD